jgi:hypothetical protein
MANISFGHITVVTPGSPVQLTANQVVPSASVLCHALLIQPATGNTGRIYIGNVSNFVKNGTGQIAWLPAPSVNVAPAFSETISYAENAIQASELWIDVDNPGEGVIASGVLA